MTLSQLEYLIAIDTHQNFARAAEACNISQPSLSVQLKKLEEELNVTLIDRSKQPTTPTEIGKLVIEQARKVLKDQKEILEIVKVEQETLKGNLRLGIIPTIAPYLLPRFIKHFTNKNPEIHLVVSEMQTQQIIESLRKETIDAGILVTPLNEPGISEMPLFYESFNIYASTSHSLSKKDKIFPADLDPEDIWLLNEGHCFRDQTINLCKSGVGRKQRQNFEFESGSLETLKNLVEQEYGYTLLPELALYKVRDTKKAVVRKFADPVPLREVSLVVNRTFLKQKLLNALQNAIRKRVPRQMLNADEGMIVEWKP